MALLGPCALGTALGRQRVEGGGEARALLTVLGAHGAPRVERAPRAQLAQGVDHGEHAAAARGEANAKRPPLRPARLEPGLLHDATGRLGDDVRRGDARRLERAPEPLVPPLLERPVRVRLEHPLPRLGVDGTEAGTGTGTEAGTGTAYVQCVAPRGKLSCASVQYSTQEAGTRARTEARRPRGARISTAPAPASAVAASRAATAGLGTRPRRCAPSCRG
eukprot:scaffold14495_cov56-Phaeocystis_antarctica.AAC.5